MTTRVLTLILITITVGLAFPDATRPVITAADGEQYVAGQLIIELSPTLRDKVNLSEKDGVALFGVPILDQLSRRWHVNDITQLYGHPDPDPLARKHGCDLQYSIQFDASQDITPVAESYEALADVKYACPNGAMELDELPDDPDYDRQWHLAKLGAPFAWGIAKGDTTVLNLVIDDGCDWLHPDIQDNLWINGPEDINGNGRFDTMPPPDGDLDGIDQDGNGYIDDVLGWDFCYYDPDPRPNPGENHGTHCWGNINAVTNNATGVAGATWNTRSPVVKCGSGGTVTLSYAISSIYYAVPLNVWAISMSFGGSSQYPPMATACQYAWDSGCVLFGSAGNSGIEARRYPACYSGVENTAASSLTDMKTSFSNYGTWIDVAAPGDGIYTTISQRSGSYGTMDGTSMSAPLAAGVACWIKSFNNTASNATAIQILHDACDSMPDPLYAQGKLGAGRVSLANVVLPLYYCDLRLADWRFNDAGGNGNGKPDPGETAALIVTYQNAENWQTATGVTATLSTGNTDVTITKSAATFPDIPAGGSGDCSADSFVITVADSAAPQRIVFSLAVAASPDPAWPDTAFTAISGDPRVLLVDDDEGEDYEQWYTAACDSNGILYDVYEVQASGSPSADTLNHYPIVIWFTGDDSTSTLTATDQTNLTGFLTGGGNLLISGQNIAQDITTLNPRTLEPLNPFLRDYLHAEFVEPSTNKPFLVGLVGDPLTQGDTMIAGGGGGAANGRSLDGIRATNGGTSCAWFKDYGDTTVSCMVRYKNGYGLVYFSVPFEAIAHSVTRYLQKWTLIRRIFDYFGERVPGVTESPPVAPNSRPYVLHITPNPFSSSALVEFIAPVSGRVELRTYTSDGRLADSQTREVSLGERARFRLDGEKLSNGVYLVQLITPTGVFAQKTAVLK